VAGVALAAYVAFLVVGFGWRAWLQYRRTGDAGFRPPSRQSGIAEWVSWPFLLIGGLLGFLAPLLAVTEAFPAMAFEPVQACGLLMVALGLILTVIAQLQLGGSWRIGVDPSEVTPLVTGGVFRFVRNPIFTGMLMGLLGLALVVPNILSVLALVLVVIGVKVHVHLVEEPYLLHMHGGRYREYARSVGRFVPKFGCLT
jgi:protein-S-isoprenylcysteine O-methyltransferase Ste14